MAIISDTAMGEAAVSVGSVEQDGVEIGAELKDTAAEDEEVVVVEGRWRGELDNSKLLEFALVVPLTYSMECSELELRMEGGLTRKLVGEEEEEEQGRRCFLVRVM